MRAIFRAAIISTALFSTTACNTKPSSDVDQANAELADARAKYVAATKARLATIDAQLDELGKRADAKSKDVAAALRVRRDQLAAKLDEVGRRAASGWTDLEKDVDEGVDSIAKDLADAMK
jgi:hypothetical protein